MASLLDIAINDFSLATLEEAAAQFFDTRVPFEKWLQSLPIQNKDEVRHIVSDCEVIFDDTLQVDDLIQGSVRSAHGTLTITANGRIEADVDVRVAVIDGCFEGTLRATEFVILNPTARVTGDIHTPSLTIKDGAVFEGTSYFLERQIYSEICKLETGSNAVLALAAGR